MGITTRRPKMRRALLYCVSIAAAASTMLVGQEQKPSGTVVGTVVDEVGSPVADAKVHAEPLDQVPQRELVRYVSTDAQGNFSIEHLGFGSYRVDAMKPADGYADAGFEFHSNGRQPKFALSSSTPKVSVLVVVGPKAGLITGPVSDAVTGKPVNATFHMWRISRPEVSYGENANSPCSVLVAPNVDVGLEVLAQGYEPWFYPGDNVFPYSMPLKLKSGEKLEMEIKLKPLAH
jgi:hypothetical protein